MSMDFRINSLNKTSEYKLNTKYKSSNTTSSTSVSKDALSISSEVQNFQTALKAAKSTPDIRQDKVDELKSKFKAGNYEINLSNIADKILG